MGLFLYFAFVIFQVVSRDIYVEVDHQNLPQNEQRENTYGWFIEALMSVDGQSKIYLGEGTHYIQTNYGDVPYLSSELSHKCALNWNDIKDDSSLLDARDIIMRRNPLRFLNYETSLSNDNSLDETYYGATFPITVTTWRWELANGTSCVTDTNVQAVLSLTNPYIQFEVLDEFTLHDLVLTGFESLAKGWVDEDCSWCQETFYEKKDRLGCGEVQQQDDAKCSSGGADSDEWIDICEQDWEGCVYTQNLNSDTSSYTTTAVCCDCFGVTGQCDDKCEQLLRSIDQSQMAEWVPFIVPDVPPTEWPRWCNDEMKANDKCEAECSFEACNYGNYYRCFPVHSDNMTDWVKLHGLSLFKIGDRAYIDPADEYLKINMLNSYDASDPDNDGRYISHDVLDCGLYEQTGTQSHRHILECSQNQDILSNNRKGLLSITSVTIQHFRQEFANLISFYPRDVTDTQVRYICNSETGLYLEDVEFKDIRTVGPIIYAPNLGSWDYEKLVVSQLIQDIDLPGTITLTDVSFVNINTIIPYETIEELTTPLPGLLYTTYFGSVELKNVTIHNASFVNPDKTAIESIPFFFDMIRSLDIDGITAENMYLTKSFLEIRNMLSGMDLSSVTTPTGAFLNFPCAQVQYNYYDEWTWKTEENIEAGNVNNPATCQNQSDQACDEVMCQQICLEGQEAKSSLDTSYKGWFGLLETAVKNSILKPLIQVSVNNLTIKDVHMKSGANSNTEPIALIAIRPEQKYSTHYSYLLENLNFERIWDFGQYGNAIIVKTTNLLSGDPTKPIQLPVDKNGNQVSTDLIIQNLNADDILLQKFIQLYSAIPVSLLNINLSNVMRYLADQDQLAFNKKTALSQIYPNNQFDNPFIEEDVIQQYTIEVEHHLAPIYYSETTGQDPLYLNPTITIQGCIFDNVKFLSAIIFCVNDYVLMYLDDIEIKNSECVIDQSSCDFVVVVMDGKVSYSGLKFSNNSANIGASSAIMAIWYLYDGEAFVNLENITISNCQDLDFIVYIAGIMNLTIENSTFQNNSVDYSVIAADAFISNYTFNFILNSVELTGNESQIGYAIQFQNVPFCRINVTGGTYSKNNGGVFNIECGVIDSASQIQQSDFYQNYKRSSGADIQISHAEGLITIGPYWNFEASTAGSGDSMVFPGLSCENWPFSYKGQLERIEENQDEFPKVHLKECTFWNFVSEGSIIESKGLVFVIIIFEGNEISHMKAGIVDLINSAFIDRNNTYTYNSGLQLYKSREQSVLLIENSTFQYNSSTDGLINAMLSRLYILQSKFHSNSSKASAGCLFLYKIVNATVYDTDFYNNTSNQYGSVAFATQQNDPSVIPITFSNCSFRENFSASMATIQLDFSNIQIKENSIFSQNRAQIYPGMYLFYSQALIEDTIFEKQFSAEAAFFRGIYSNATITRCNFTEAVGIASSVLKMSDSSELIISNSSITDIQSKEGAISIDLVSKLLVDGVNVRQTYAEQACSVLHWDKSNCTIVNSSFRDSSHTMIFVEAESVLNIRNTQMINSTSSDFGGFVFAFYSQFDFENVEFDSGKSSVGGALFYQNDGLTSVKNYKTDIKNWTFRNNSADQGGAIYTISDIRLIDSTSFIQNTAYSKNSEGMGGAINCNCDSQTCELEVIDSTFRENSAQGGGGGIYWSQNPPTMTNWVSENNTAKYGDFMSSPPSSIAYIPRNTTSADNRKMTDTDNELNEIFQGMPSGQDTYINVTIGILDFYGNIAKIKEIYQATIYGDEPTFIKGTTQVQSKDGTFIFDNVIIQSPPGINAKVKIFTEAVQDLGVTTKSEINLDFYMRKCIAGEILQDNECKVCYSEGKKYTFEASGEECLDCPDEAIWLGGDEIYPKAGYWRSGWNSSNFYQCHVEISWMGGNDTQNPQGDCNEDRGYSGRMWNVCKSDYVRLGKYEWSKCPNETANVFILLCMLMLTITLIGIILKANLKAAALRKREKIGVYTKIMTNYLQIIALVNSFKLDWPQFVLDYYETQDEVGSSGDRMFSFDWYLKNFDGVVFYQNLVIIALLPIAIILTSSLFFTVWGFLTDSMAKCFLENAACILVSFFLIHPNIIKTTFVAFSWTKIDNSLYLEIDMSQECWTGDHLMYVLTVSIPALIVWGFGMPAFAVSNLRRHYLKDDIFAVHTLSKYGFLYNGYKFQYYYWELFILYRKCLIVFILVFFSLISIQVQALSALLVLVIALIIHNKRMPFERRNLNMLETQSIISAAITIYCGLYYMSESLDEITKVVFFFVILFVNIRFFVTWALVFANEFAKKFKRDHEKLFGKLFGSCQYVKRVLKYKGADAYAQNMPLKTRRLSEIIVIDRLKFLDMNLKGNFKTIKELTDKQYKFILKSKGNMMMKLMDNMVQNDILNQDEISTPNIISIESVNTTKLDSTVDVSSSRTYEKRYQIDLDTSRDAPSINV